MENKTFRAPAVAGLLREKFVEARLHTDGEEPVHDEIRTLRDQLTSGNLTTPIYIVMDPVTGAQIGRLNGAFEDRFIRMIQEIAGRSGKG
jgi:hypothetical protein